MTNIKHSNGMVFCFAAMLITGSDIRVTLDIALNPNKFIIAQIVINIKTTISRSMLGKYISTKLSVKELMQSLFLFG